MILSSRLSLYIYMCVCMGVCKKKNIQCFFLKKKRQVYNTSFVGFLAIQQLNLEKLLNSSYSSSTSDTAKS